MDIVSRRPDISSRLLGILQKKSSHLQKLNSSFIPFNPDNFPLDFRKISPEFKGYTLEIGSGWGEFALENAKQNPDILHVCLEKKSDRLRYSLKKQANASVTNIRWFQTNIHWKFSGIFAADQFTKVIINFPDPWPKKRHQKNRFISPEFLQEVHKISHPDGLLEFATDHWPYMESAMNDFGTMENVKLWENLDGKKMVLQAIQNRPISYFEKLKRSQGENIYFTRWRKVAN